MAPAWAISTAPKPVDAYWMGFKRYGICIATPVRVRGGGIMKVSCEIQDKTAGHKPSQCVPLTVQGPVTPSKVEELCKSNSDSFGQRISQYGGSSGSISYFRDDWSTAKGRADSYCQGVYNADPSAFGQKEVDCGYAFTSCRTGSWDKIPACVQAASHGSSSGGGPAGGSH